MILYNPFFSKSTNYKILDCLAYMAKIAQEASIYLLKLSIIVYGQVQYYVARNPLFLYLAVYYIVIPGIIDYIWQPLPPFDPFGRGGFLFYNSYYYDHYEEILDQITSELKTLENPNQEPPIKVFREEEWDPNKFKKEEHKPNTKVFIVERSNSPYLENKDTGFFACVLAILYVVYWFAKNS